MTTKIITLPSICISLCLSLAVLGVQVAQASEITGTLSSNTETTPSGSVESNSGGGSRSSNRTSSTDTTNSTPGGSVLGASTSNLTAPGFPNAGVDPTTATNDPNHLTRVVSYLHNLISFNW